MDEGGSFDDVASLIADTLATDLPLDDIFARVRVANLSTARLREAIEAARGVGVLDAPTILRMGREAWVAQAQAAQFLVDDQAHKEVREKKMRNIAERTPPTVPGQWYWKSSLDRKTCAYCIAMHGTAHPLGVPMEGLTHPNCRCIPVDTPMKMGWRWLRGQKAAVQNAILHRAVATRMRAGDLGPEQIVDYSNHRRRSLRNIFGENQKKTLMRRAKRKYAVRRRAPKGMEAPKRSRAGQVADILEGVEPEELVIRPHGLRKPKLQVEFHKYFQGDRDETTRAIDDTTKWMWDWARKNGLADDGTNWNGKVILHPQGRDDPNGLKSWDCSIHLYGDSYPQPNAAFAHDHWKGTHVLMHEFLHAISKHDEVANYVANKYLEEVPVEHVARNAWWDWLADHADQSEIWENISLKWYPSGYEHEHDDFIRLLRSLGVQEDAEDEFIYSLFDLSQWIRPHYMEAVVNENFKGQQAKWRLRMVKNWAWSGQMVKPQPMVEWERKHLTV